jgi:octaprenyl-diphosphate synthase
MQNGLFAVIAEELLDVEERLQAPAAAGEALLQAVTRYAVGSGGKRIRPALLLLAARACGGDQRERSLTLASAAEMMHAASLLHDDIVDRAATRRGRPSAPARGGPGVSVRVGDFLYSRAVQALVTDPDRRILQAFADATVAMTEAEILQLERLRDLAIDKEVYLAIVRGKTAALMSAACRAGALMAGAETAWVDALAAFGLNLGIGFQLVDDALDYSAHEERLGKPVGSDLREGKITYPIIHCVRTGSTEDRRRLETLARQPDLSDADRVALRELVERSGGVAATMQLVDEYLAQARAHLGGLPDSPASRTLDRLVDFVRERDW